MSIERPASVRRHRVASGAVRRLGRTLAVFACLAGTWTNLRRFGAGANASPREAELPDEHLRRVLEDPRAPEDVRAGAATALRDRVDEDGRARMRLVAADTASPRLRLAISSATEDDER